MNYEIRQSQLIHTWPAGSMIDFPELSLILLNHDHAINDWGIPDNGQDNPNQKKIIKDNRLAEAFNVDHFINPPALDGVNNLSAWGIRFPRAQYCPKCTRIYITNRDMGMAQNRNGRRYNETMEALSCQDCLNNQTGLGPKLVPMRFVIATEEGFLDDFPWDWYVHNKKPNERGRGHTLYFKSKGGSASLNDIFIESYSGNQLIAKRDLGEIFNQEIFTEICPVHGHYLSFVNGFMPKPWKGWYSNTQFVQELISVIPQGNLMNGDELSEEAKRKFPRTMQRGAGNIIFPIVYSGILLPHETYEQQCPPEVKEIIATQIESLKDAIPENYESFSSDQWRDFFLQQVLQNSNHKLNRLEYTASQIRNYIISHFGKDSSQEFINKAVLLRRQEFKAFIGNYLEDYRIWFKKKNIDGQEYNSLLQVPDLLDQVILLEKLSALKVYKGFTRVKPLMNEELVFATGDDNLGEAALTEFQRIQDARKDPLHTRELPAVEVRGEGIFLKFNNKKLNEWAEKYPASRLNTINENLRQANIDFGQENHLINKRYLFLHTFSHIILKELSEDCGYSLSSLAEIIYCSTDSEISTNEEMNGILIYTTSTDSEGSLGGLVEKGEPRYFSSVIKKGVDKARWCSSDPLCITTDQGQGFMGLNLAACYSCVLLPETSCEKMNKYLDRAAIIGNLENLTIGMF